MIPILGLNAWYNINCGLSRPFVCKKEASSTEPITKPATTIPAGGCPDGNRIGNMCYKLVTKSMSWDNARKDCAKNNNGELASIPEYAVQGETQFNVRSFPLM